MRTRHRAVWAALLLALFASFVHASDANRPTTVLFVRHAEKAAEPREDPALSDAGRARASELARVVGAAGVTSIITSQYARTKQTAEPLAARLGVAPAVVPLEVDQETKHLTPDSIERLVAKILEHPGATVLVVGHSNTIPEVIAALGADVAPIDEKVYDDLFVVTVSGPKRATALHLKFGAPSGT